MILVHQIRSWLKECDHIDEIMLQLHEGIQFHCILRINECYTTLVVLLLTGF